MEEVADERNIEPRGDNKPPSLGEAWEAMPPKGKLLFIVIVPLVMVAMLWGAMSTGGSAGGPAGACEQYSDDIARQITWLQMADDSLSFSDAHIQAEMIEGPPPSGC